MKAARILILFISFFIDVKVRAEECFGRSVPCAVRAASHRKALHNGKMQLVLAPDSLLETRKDGLRLVSGQMYVESQDPVRLTTPFGSFLCEREECYALLERQAEGVKLQALRGYWQIQRKGDQMTYGLPPGMEISVGRVDLNGKAEMEFPQSLPWDSTLKSWARLFTGSPERFKELVSEFRSIWREAVEAATDLQQREAGRTIASHQADLDKEAARRRAQEREDESLRKLFREKNNIYP